MCGMVKRASAARVTAKAWDVFGGVFGRHPHQSEGGNEGNDVIKPLTRPVHATASSYAALLAEVASHTDLAILWEPYWPVDEECVPLEEINRKRAATRVSAMSFDGGMVNFFNRFNRAAGLGFNRCQLFRRRLLNSGVDNTVTKTEPMEQTARRYRTSRIPSRGMPASGGLLQPADLPKR